MNLLDILLLALVAISGLMSLKVGLVREIFALGALLVGILVAVVLTRALAGSLPDLLGSRVVTQVVFFLVVFLAVHILISLVGTFASNLVRAGHLGWADRLLGFLFGCLRGAVVAVLVIVGLTFVLPAEHGLLVRSRAVPLARPPIVAFADLLPAEARDALLARYEAVQGHIAEARRAAAPEQREREEPALGRGVAL